MGLGPRPTSRALSAAVVLALLVPGAAAITPSVAIGRLLHDSWTEGNGVTLGSVHAVGQGSDGYLWIGSDTGVHRFDGLRFSGPPLRADQNIPPGAVQTTFSAPDGSLWLATRENVVRISDGSVETWASSDLRRTVGHIEAAGAGAVWALAPLGISLLTPGDRSARRFTAADGLPGAVIHAIAPAGPGALWLGIGGAVCRWTPGSPAACHVLPGVVYALFSRGPDDVYAAGNAVVAHISHGAVQILTRDLSDVTILTGSLTVDRHGSVWIGTANGLLRLRQGALEHFTHRDGLSADTVQTLFEDAEGDLWVGTSAGLDRFRDPRVLHLTSLDGLSGDVSTAVAADPAGAVWIGSLANGLTRWDHGRISTYSRAQGLPGKQVFSLAFDTKGVLWASGDHGIARLQDGRFVPGFPDGGSPLGQVFSIAGDSSGGIWFADQTRGALRLFGGRVSLLPELPQTDLFRLVGMPDGSMWLGYYSSGVVRWRNGEVQPFDLRAAGAASAPRAMCAGRDGAVWVGAGRVLARIRDGKITTWGPRQGLPPEDIQGIVEDSAGVLWAATPESVLRIVPPEPGAMLRLTRYSHVDGVHRRNPAGMYGPRIAVAADGRVWVSELDGVGILDPELLRPDTVPPPVQVEQITVDGAPLAWGVHAFRGHEIRIQYTGISLRAPERVHFKYRLDPGSQAWTDNQNQRYVYFISPAPGKYSFRLMACNLDEVCNDQGGAVEFEIVPYFSQTVWAKLLWVALGLSILYGLHSLNVERLKRRFRLAAQERARVTREMHDTLLQGFAGVVYQLDAASRQFDTHPDASRDRLHKALDQADNALTEARRTLQDMRLPVLEDSTLPEALQDVGAKAVDSGAAFSLRVKGTVAPLPYAAQAAMFLIGREAIHNAAKHSGAGRITVHLHYRERDFRMTIVDDGAGFDPAEAKKKVGHFGVDSMAVRARQAGAEFQLDTAPGKGVAIAVTVKR
jgi:ligand-binding sensor domain-containing protein/two-component sensor histidine kinase